MNPSSLKIGASCGFGALIGALIVTFLSLRFCWVGMIVGGLVGYVSYEFKNVIRATKRTYRELSSRDWSWEKMRASVIPIVGWSMPIFSIGLWMLPLIRLPPSSSHDMLLVEYVMIVLATMTAYLSCAGRIIFGFLDSNYDEAVIMLKWFNPVSFPLTCVVLLFVSMYKLLCDIIEPLACRLKRIPHYAAFMLKFCRRVFILIHSEKRAICFMDATLGALIGGFAGHSSGMLAVAALVGAISGALLGILNYNIVSVRWLKLKPA